MFQDIKDSILDIYDEAYASDDADKMYKASERLDEIAIGLRAVSLDCNVQFLDMELVGRLNGTIADEFEKIATQALAFSTALCYFAEEIDDKSMTLEFVPIVGVIH